MRRDEFSIIDKHVEHERKKERAIVIAEVLEIIDKRADEIDGADLDVSDIALVKSELFCIRQYVKALQGEKENE